MNQFTIRKLRKADIPKILRKKYSFSPSYLLPNLSLTSMIFGIINNRIGIKNEKFSIVLEKDNDILGVLTYFNFDDKIWVAGPLFVSPDARGMGVGKKLVSAANKILKNRELFKVYGDVPLNNPSKYLHTQLGCKFIDFSFVLSLEKNKISIFKPLSDINFFRTLNQTAHIFAHIKTILSPEMIDFFNITEQNYYYPFDSSLRKISRIFFKKVKYLVFNRSLILLNEIRFKPIYDIMIFLNSHDDLDYLVQKIMNQLNFAVLTGRLFFKQSITYEKIQNALEKLGITHYLNETMVYFFKDV
jgi:N-acetylglutamate synthase-like GNAT family acetyltransferase